MAATNARSDARFQARRRGGRYETDNRPSAFEAFVWGADLHCRHGRSSSGVGRLQLQRVSGDINASADCGTDAGSDNWRYTHIHTRWRTADQLPIAVLQPHGVRQPFRVGYRDLIIPGSNLAAGTEAVLTAAPATGYAFDYWSGDASGTSISTTLNMESNRSVTAYFVPNTVRSMLVTPASASMETRRAQRFKAVATYSDGSTADVTNRVTWRSSNPTVATIASSGQAIRVSAGSWLS